MIMRYILASFLITLGATPALAASPTPLASPAAVPKPAAGEVRINEFLPNPAGTDTGNEWVELANVSDHAVDAGGLVVARLSGSTIITVPSGTTIAAGAVFAMTATGSLINSGDTLILKSGSTELDRVTYDDLGGEGESWARQSATEGAWTDTPSKGEVNPVPNPEAAPDPEAVIASTTGAARSATTKASTTKASTAKASTKAVAAKKLPAGGAPWAGYALPAALAMLYWYKRIRPL